ncbi:hypothetical protein [Bacteroides gallinarum]|uniref:hypothetical protein n=1 Tax=Bacteroides gallinarum TaxID=376806 RepID=UPI00036FA46C|nr:hypothetical protein [Bacteroides gallinarum]
MGRQDILMDARYGEMETTDNLASKPFYAFRFLGDMEGMDNDRFLYAEISVPEGFGQKLDGNAGIHVSIPYTPVYKSLSVRFLMDTGNGNKEYTVNRKDNGIWFPVRAGKDSGRADIRLSEFLALNVKGNFRLVPEDGILSVYSADETDLRIGVSKSQNEVFLLKAAPGNLYQHPTTGVGLIDFLHSNLENNGLAARLQSEFLADGMIVKNAYMDSSTGELLLEVEEKEATNG